MRRASLAGWLLVAVVVAVVELLVRLLDLDDSVAAPSAAFAALANGLWSGSLSGELARTLATFAAGLALAIVVGVVLGVVLGSSRTLDDAFSVIVEVMRPIPAVAIIPLAILVFGLGPPMLRFVIAYAAVKENEYETFLQVISSWEREHLLLNV